MDLSFTLHHWFGHYVVIIGTLLWLVSGVLTWGWYNYNCEQWVIEKRNEGQNVNILPRVLEIALKLLCMIVAAAGGPVAVLAFLINAPPVRLKRGLKFL